MFQSEGLENTSQVRRSEQPGQPSPGPGVGALRGLHTSQTWALSLPAVKRKVHYQPLSPHLPTPPPKTKMTEVKYVTARSHSLTEDWSPDTGP